ncbi:MAG: DUF1329 domain-containing protein [Myxococcota bacterium]
MGALRRRCQRWMGLCAAGAAGVLAAAAPAGAAPPPEGECPVFSGIPGGGPTRDAAPVRIREGMLLAYEDILLLGKLLPVEVWRNRDAFFHDGMRLEIGPCHRRYPVPAFFREATAEHGGKATLDDAGNLRGHVAGLPFPPEGIDPKAPDAALRWAWNFERRWRGAGPAGKFRLVDMPGRIGGIQTYEGEWYFLQTTHRSDLKQAGYRSPIADETQWIAGGEFHEPTNARHLAWMQQRPAEVAEDFDHPDDTFVYVPTMRKMRRAVSSWVDGVYTPRYRVTGDAGGGGMPFGGGEGMGLSGSISPNAGESIAITENLRRGFVGLAIRPNAYVWRMLGEREVLAPINVTRGGYPQDEERNFGPSGLSVGNDRWDVRWAVVIQGAVKERGRDYDLLTLWIDYQTQQPLYYIAKLRRGSRVTEVGIQLHRFSGDLSKYPLWPDGSPANVFDPVGAVFFDAADGGSGWRREAYDTLSLPRDPEDLHRMSSPSFLERGH